MVCVLWINKRNRCTSQATDLIPLLIARKICFSMDVSIDFGSL